MPHPVLQAMVLADHVYQDRLTGKYIIAGTFSRIFFGKSPDRSKATGPADEPKIHAGPTTRAGSPYLYLALVDVKGQVPLDLRFIDLSDASVLLSANLVVAAPDPLVVAEFVIAMPQLPIRGVGNYSLDLLHAGAILGSWRVEVAEMENPPSEKHEDRS